MSGLWCGNVRYEDERTKAPANIRMTSIIDVNIAKKSMKVISVIAV